MSIRAVVAGTGMAVPDNIVTNDDLAKIVDTNDEWIRQRTGIGERRICREGETGSQLATTALTNALGKAKLGPDDLDMIICATVSPDYIFPSNACLIQDAIGAKRAGAFDLGAACAGFIYATSVAGSMIEAGRAKHVAVVGVDTLSKHVDWSDRGTCVLFGDGAGAVILTGQENTDRGILHTEMLSDGGGACHILIEAGGSKYPMSSANSAGHNPKIYMAGSEVYRFAVGAMGDACQRVLDNVGLKSEDISLFVPHQANIRIIESAAKRLELPPEKVFINVDRYGNTSAGSIPIGLYEASESGRLEPGDLVMTVGFGAGLVWGANLIRW
ncbi:MAG: ketoacyl-ACP synthase III [Chthonomonas sp.]|nr:ketoacyl-ACP synthase III [Chthonomonas sp.]